MKRGRRHFELRILSYCNSYYIDRIADLEAALSRKPRVLQLDMIGVGEIPADSALLIRSILIRRPAQTRIITNARSSLQGGSVLIWLMGDVRFLRDDATVFFRKADLPEKEKPADDDVWKDSDACAWNSSSSIDPEEGDHARMLEAINEFLPVKELVGRIVEKPLLREFGLVDNETMDGFLKTVFRKRQTPRAVPVTPDSRIKPVKSGSPRTRRIRR
ncbi:MAG TPA: hypothetical protein VK968_01080 [Roseimicrobium sp.]|nr:hypothetical protein [Roseimicrobium sp.]